jgi:hypothetical protein
MLSVRRFQALKFVREDEDDDVPAQLYERRFFQVPFVVWGKGMGKTY